MYLFLDNISCPYGRTGKPVIRGLSLYVAVEIVSVGFGPAGAGKTTLLHYVRRRSDGQDGVFLGSDQTRSKGARV